MVYKAFISHSWAQKDFVNKIADYISRDKCIVDDHDFEKTRSIKDQILQNIDSCQLYVLVLSPEALQSDWIQFELDEIHRKLENRSVRDFCPIQLGDLNLDDPKLPDWLKQNLIYPITEHLVIGKKIQQRLREIALKADPILQQRENIYVTRSSLHDNFDKSLFTFKSKNYTSIVASGLKGVGRRTFLKEAYKRNNIFPQNEPIYISLESDSTIDDLYLQLSIIRQTEKTDILAALQDLSIKDKVNLIKERIKSIASYQERLLILDNGCIIQSNNYVAPWFLKIIDDPEFENKFIISVVSIFRPSKELLLDNDCIIEFNVPALDKAMSEQLFIRYAALRIPEIDKDILAKSQIANCFDGIPAQIFFAVNKIAETGLSNIDLIKRKVIEFGKNSTLPIIQQIEEDGQFAKELLVLICSYGRILSYDMLKRIVDDHELLDEILTKFYTYGVFEYFGYSQEFIKVNFAIEQFINRSKEPIKPQFQIKIKDIVTEFFANSNDEDYLDDLSSLYISVKEAITSGQKIPPKFYLPSFVLGSIRDLYDSRKFKSVIEISRNMLDNSHRMEERMEWQFENWLCMALAREKDEQFETEVTYFNDSYNFHFLWGFYYRQKGYINDAKKELRKALDLNPDHQKTKRELVSVLVREGKYSEALKMAKENYEYNETSKLNPFHIEAYFSCLINQDPITAENRCVIDELMEHISLSRHRKTADFQSYMESMYEFYIKQNKSMGIQMMEQCYQKSVNKSRPKQALERMYLKDGKIDAYHNIKNKREDFDIED